MSIKWNISHICTHMRVMYIKNITKLLTNCSRNFGLCSLGMPEEPLA